MIIINNFIQQQIVRSVTGNKASLLYGGNFMKFKSNYSNDKKYTNCMNPTAYWQQFYRQPEYKKQLWQ